MKSMPGLDSTPILQSVATKLPSYSGVKWCRFAHDTQIKQRRVMAFKANFLSRRTEKREEVERTAKRQQLKHTAKISGWVQSKSGLGHFCHPCKAI